ncbi:MAG TPA: dTDP-4-dehydrorhamnose 3,5-epimerase [Gemmataceae bacterium]|nr:dTDP-4-dehydrorhamnose 3,5-epimerase [Gemmataceae bacterium]
MASPVAIRQMRVRPHQTVAIDPSAALDLLPFRPGIVEDVIWRPLTSHRDERGWLCEMFRQDELAPGDLPAMGYLSETLPGATRGPHEHLQQTDCFCFFGAATFHLYLWDNRPESASYLCHEIAIVGGGQPMRVIVPPGIVHAYRNVSAMPGLVVNCPNRLYRGEGKADPVDEIRHEDDPRSVFRLLDVN